MAEQNTDRARASDDNRAPPQPGLPAAAFLSHGRTINRAVCTTISWVSSYTLLRTQFSRVALHGSCLPLSLPLFNYLPEYRLDLVICFLQPEYGKAIGRTSVMRLQKTDFRPAGPLGPSRLECSDEANCRVGEATREGALGDL